MRGVVATGTSCEEMLRTVGQSRVEVNAGQRSCACDWLCWYVATGTRRGKRCALFCVLRLDDQQLVLGLSILCDIVWISCLVSCIVVVDFLQGCEGERQYRTLISLLGLLATMRRVVNYHSSWARQQQVEFFDASGNPGSTAGRGFNPAGGAPGCG
ncbi:hypothetical protein F511_13774 [Dorcoceras hygrometricum]|uniref:Uncharacterized protein n=1 Tax=Dorcoceras hygrometricum TaxID=472368 RepID=A0A2Z7CZ79_9LAMI|nr:hypothetical protein F511_13774 [Dorcoceras hygrometricum]